MRKGQQWELIPLSIKDIQTCKINDSKTDYVPSLKWRQDYTNYYC
jgi:hypothetical protein